MIDGRDRDKVRPELKGARWSSAVRCVAKAEYQALGIMGEHLATGQPHPLQEAFTRGVSAAENWIEAQERLCDEQGKTLYREVEVAWGPGSIWTGHADAVIMPDALVMEAYHSIGGKFVEAKALQAAFYALKLGPEYRAMLCALDPTNIDIDGGYVVTPYRVDVDGKMPEVAAIEAAIEAAYEAGEVNPADKVGDSPDHGECRTCEFREACWFDYTPPTLEERTDLLDLLERVALAQSNYYYAKTAQDEAGDVLRHLKDELRPFTKPGVPLRGGGVQVTRALVEPRKSFKLTDYLRAGFPITPEMEDYANEAPEPGERWYVKRVDP